MGCSVFMLCFCFFKNALFSHILPLFYTGVSVLIKTFCWVPSSMKPLPQKYAIGLRLVSCPSVLWFANHLVHVVQKCHAPLPLWVVACSRGQGLLYVNIWVSDVTNRKKLIVVLNSVFFIKKYLTLHLHVHVFMLNQQHYTLTKVKKVKS